MSVRALRFHDKIALHAQFKELNNPVAQNLYLRLFMFFNLCIYPQTHEFLPESPSSLLKIHYHPLTFVLRYRNVIPLKAVVLDILLYVFI